MKKTILTAVLLAAFGSAMATGGVAGSSLTGAAGSVSGSAAFATSAGNGASFSGASNQTWSSVGGSAVGEGRLASGSADVAGQASTGSVSQAGNLSFGNATGGAAAGGLSTATVVGTANYAGIGVGGAAGGFATSTTGNAVVAGPNEYGYVAANNVAGFVAGADSSITRDGWKLKNDAQTNAGAYSVSNAVGFGNADIYNINGGTAGAAAVAFAGGQLSSTPTPSDNEAAVKCNNGRGNGYDCTPGNSWKNNAEDVQGVIDHLKGPK